MLKSSSKILLLLVTLCLFYFGVEQAKAASLYFDAPAGGIGDKNDANIDLNITSPNSLNAISVSLIISSNIEIVGVEDGNSIINLWVERPLFDPISKQLSFSGIVPSGFSGNDLHLLTLKLRAKGQGTAAIHFLPEGTKAYLNTPDGISDRLTFEDLNLSILNGQTNNSRSSIDKDPPEPFSPKVERSTDLFSGKWFLVFSTTDKGSGVLKYQVAESRSRSIPNNRLKWKEVENPYLLDDQALKSHIYVKAIDNSMNERIEEIQPPNGLIWYEDQSLQAIIIGVIMLILIFSSFFFKWKKRLKA